MRNFQVFFYIVGRRVLTPLLCEDPPILPTPPPLFPILSNSTPTALPVVLFLWLNEWSCHIRCTILLNDNMDLHMSSLGTAVPEGPWCVFFATRHQVYWGMNSFVRIVTSCVFYLYSDLISHTQTHKHTQHTQGPVDWHTHINVYLHHLLCAHSSYFITLND